MLEPSGACQMYHTLHIAIPTERLRVYLTHPASFVLYIIWPMAADVDIIKANSSSLRRRPKVFSLAVRVRF